MIPGATAKLSGYVMSVWERLLLIHLLRCFEQRELGLTALTRSPFSSMGRWHYLARRRG